MTKFLKSFVLILSLFTVGCANHGDVLQKSVEQQAKQFEQQAKSKIFNVVDEPYLGGTTRQRDARTPELDKSVTLSQRGTMADLVANLGTIMPNMVFQVLDGGDEPMATSSDSTLVDQLSVPKAGQSGTRYKVYFEGTLKGLLDHIASVSGYGWTFNSASNSVTFGQVLAKTYNIFAIAGKSSYENNITNRSKESNAGAIGGAGIGQTVSTSDTSIQTAQTTGTKLEFDVWEEVVGGVKALLSAKGTVSGNQSAGTITVRDSASRLRQVDTYIEDINERYARQVALTVQVWSLQLNDDSDVGFNLQGLFENADVSVVAGNLADLGMGTVAASIVSGKLKGSDATLKALRQWGDAAQVSTGGGVVMSNQPLPVLAIQRHAYMAGVNTTTNDYGQTTQLTPGEVTSGFSMTVIPNVVDKRRVILQYNINLSSLDEMVKFSTDEIVVELPQMSNRSFSQRMHMKMGQTLVLAGFQQESTSTSKSFGFLSGGRKGTFGKSLLIITIAVESAEV